MKASLIDTPSMTTHRAVKWLPGFFVRIRNIVLPLKNWQPSLLALGFFLAASGCEETDTGTLNPSGTVPQIAGTTLSPATVNVDTITPVNGLYSIRTTVEAEVSDVEDDVSEVVARILRLNENTTLEEILLHDDGTVPDSIAGDGVFSGSFGFEIIRADAGNYRIQVHATDRSQLSSNIVEQTLMIQRANSPPLLDESSLSAPDTVVVPPGGFAFLFMSIGAEDPDGLPDIQSVYFTSPDGGNPDFRFPMKDDGGADPGPQSGDLVAGDGVFSILLTISDSPTVRGDYRFLFKAEDTFGDTSATITHVLAIR